MNNTLKMSRVRKWLIRWQTRLLSKKLNAQILILGVLVFSNNFDLEAQLEELKNYVYKTMPPRLAPKIFERIVINVVDYRTNEALYLKDRTRVFELLVQNIQLYRFVLDIWEGDSYKNQLDILKIAVQNAYDKRYHLDKQSQRALLYQMRQRLL
ncbi:hypothetical protein [Helicobacter cynogastricus]|uniref:hypothetical protein n=1 Tax=Helicobacter cynogastricus TaxID=329937 RepID=UPI000CF16C66|nr:hypothetical protein [Helicobacter cynogastricus]